MATLTIEIPDHLADRLVEAQPNLEQILKLGLGSLSSISKQLSEEIFDFFSRGPSTAEIAVFVPSEKVQAQISALLEKNSAGTITKEEIEDLDQIGALNDFVSILKIRAQKTIAQQKA